jgi:hypothetical protein
VVESEEVQPEYRIVISRSWVSRELEDAVQSVQNFSQIGGKSLGSTVQRGDGH